MIDFEKFLTRHDLIWERAPQAWEQAPFLGNGMLGTMLYQVGPQSLRLDVSRADYYGHRDGFSWITRSRMPIGHFTLETSAAIRTFEGRLDLWNAEFRAVVTTAQGAVILKALVHSDDMLIIYTLETSGDEHACRFVWYPAEAIPPARNHALQELAKNPDTKDEWIQRWSVPYEANPPFTSAVDGDVELCHQALLEGGGTTTAWQELDDGAGCRTLYISVAHAYPQDFSQAEAVAAVHAAQNTTLAALVTRHRAWWHRYYPASFISIPDAHWEGFYWIQMYKLACATRPERVMIDCMGPWYQQSDWPLAWFNLNVQLTYWCVADSNRLDMGESLIGRFDRYRDTLIANMPAEFGGDCAGFYTTVPPDLYSPWEMQSLGDLPWAMHDYWMMVRRSMDETRMREQFYPLLKLSINTYLKVMIRGDDGRLHLPHSFSPETGWAPDANYNLALLRWGCETLIALGERLGIEDPLVPQWREVLDTLVEYPTDASGYMLGADTPLDFGHRHYSHLLMIYPLYLINIEQEGQREIIEHSLAHWIGFEKGKCLYTWAGAASIAAALTEGNRALDYLERTRHEPSLASTTLYSEGGYPVMESPLAMAQCIHDMLLQSWGTGSDVKIRVFPAVPDAWQDLCFSELRAEGAFLVSAARKGGETQWITIRSLAGEPCRIKTDMREPVLANASAHTLTRIAPGLYALDLKKGEEAVLLRQGASDSATDIAPVDLPGGKANMFGLNAHHADPQPDCPSSTSSGPSST